MPTMKISRDTIKIAVAIDGRRTLYFDTELPGFGILASPNGRRTFIAQFRVGEGGRGAAKKRIAVGTVGVETLDEARARARVAIAEARVGRDPAGERAEVRSAKTVDELAKLWIKGEIKPTRKASTAALYDIYLRKHILPAIGTMKARDVTRARVAKLHREIGADAAVTANRVVQCLSGLFAWAVTEGELPDDFTNPCKGVTKFREAAKERFLSSEEVVRLGDALRLAETEGLPWTSVRTKKNEPRNKRRTVFGADVVAAIRLLLFTGCRLREILHLRWADIDFERGLAVLADSKTGRKPVVLPAPALAVLDGLPKVGEYVIPGADPKKPRADLKKPWAAISAHAGLDGVRLHDLRHSFAATGAGAGLGLPVIGRLLGHSQPSTTARYAHLAADPVREAADRIAGTLSAALDGRPAAEVVPINVRSK